MSHDYTAFTCTTLLVVVSRQFPENVTVSKPETLLASPEFPWSTGQFTGCQRCRCIDSYTTRALTFFIDTIITSTQTYIASHFFFGDDTSPGDSGDPTLGPQAAGCQVDLRVVICLYCGEGGPPFLLRLSAGLC